MRQLRVLLWTGQEATAAAFAQPYQQQNTPCLLSAFVPVATATISIETVQSSTQLQGSARTAFSKQHMLS